MCVIRLGFVSRADLFVICESNRVANFFMFLLLFQVSVEMPSASVVTRRSTCKFCYTYNEAQYFLFL